MNGHAEAVRAQYREILRFVRRRTGSREDAEDVTQEVFRSAAEALANSAVESPPTLAWLYTVARRRLIDQARKARVTTTSIDDTMQTTTASEEYGPSVTAALTTALGILPEGQRRVVVMKLIQGRGFAEIGRELGLTEEACRMRFMRGLEQLRWELERQGVEP